MAYKDKGILWVIATLYLTEMLRRFRTEDLEISLLLILKTHTWAVQKISGDFFAADTKNAKIWRFLCGWYWKRIPERYKNFLWVVFTKSVDTNWICVFVGSLIDWGFTVVVKVNSTEKKWLHIVNLVAYSTNQNVYIHYVRAPQNIYM